MPRPTSASSSLARAPSLAFNGKDDLQATLLELRAAATAGQGG